MLPTFPIQIQFDIEHAPETRDVWAHPQARTLALLWRPCHVVDQYFWSECLTLGREIATRKPITADELRQCLAIHTFSARSNFTPSDIRAFADEALAYFTGTDVPYEVHLLEKERP